MNNQTSKLSSNFKDIYKEINRLNTEFYPVFKRMSQPVRFYRGHYIVETLTSLINQVADTYFNRSEKLTYQEHLRKIYSKLKHLEFNLRICYDLNFIDEKSRINMNKTIGILSKLLKDEMKIAEDSEQNK